MAEIAHRPGIDAIGADAGFGDVEIDLHDPFLGPHRLDQDSEPGFQALSEIAAILPEEGVLGGLLADRRAAADLADAFEIARHGLLYRLEIEAVVGAEIAI